MNGFASEAKPLGAKVTCHTLWKNKQGGSFLTLHSFLVMVYKFLLKSRSPHSEFMCLPVRWAADGLCGPLCWACSTQPEILPSVRLSLSISPLCSPPFHTHKDRGSSSRFCFTPCPWATVWGCFEPQFPYPTKGRSRHSFCDSHLRVHSLPL